MLEMVLRVRVLLEQRGLAARESSFELAQARLELAEMEGRASRVGLDRPVDVDEELLLEEPDAGAPCERDAAGVGLIEARRDPEERRLPHAVRPDQPDPITMGQAEAHLGEQHPVGEPSGHRLDGEQAHAGLRRGARWQPEQWNVLRPPMTERAIGRPHRAQGSPARP